MTKGIYNENEFYANFYWDSKFREDLNSKIGEDSATQNSISALKALDAKFWSLKEISEGDPKKSEALVSFYKDVFTLLGYRSDPKDHQASSGQLYSLFVDERRADGRPNLFAILVDQVESGAFEGPPKFVGSIPVAEQRPVEDSLADLIQDEFQDAQNPPRWILVGAPNALFVIERNKWSFGRYLRIEWQEIFLQRDLEPYKILFGISSKRVLSPEIGGALHDEFDDNSHRHAFEVTTELRESVREAVEILINEMIDLKKESHQKIYSEAAADQYAKELTHDALYYVYRLLFLLYLEAQGDDSELLPLKSGIYRNGYSLEKLLELDYIDVAPDSVESKGTFLFESLDQIFNLIFYGFEPGKEGIFKNDLGSSGFWVKGIKSDLFDPSIIKHLSGVRLRNGVLLDVLKKLSLTRRRERGGGVRARVSYANLGINQLGAVYEGLLSYSGFFAQEDLHALKPESVKQSDIDNGKELDQIYLAPKSLVEKFRKAQEKSHRISDANVVLDDSGNPRIYKKGSFVYRLAGRDRQKLASFYTPESLTKTTVKYSLKVLFETKRTLESLWSVRILEPAMGSGAFLNEAVNQLAEKILELEVLADASKFKTPAAKRKRNWEIKHHLIANNVYGVDLNQTAIELGRFSLWLNCLGAGKEPPNFAGRLRVGNSLIGARFKKGADGFFPWLILADGMLAHSKKLKEYDAVGAENLKSLRADFLGSRVGASNELLLKAQMLAEGQLSALMTNDSGDREAAYVRLKHCADFWCALFFVSPKELSEVPKTHEEYLKTIVSILSSDPSRIGECGVGFSQGLASQEKFFHWDIEFPEILMRGGFDLVVGNPPWVAVEWKEALYASDINPIPAILELDAKATNDFLLNSGQSVREFLVENLIRVSGYSGLLEADFYSSLKGLSKNTYKAFNILSFALASHEGAIGLIQQDGVLEDVLASVLRGQIYQQLAYHFQFINQKKLFAEVGNTRLFSINIFRGRRNSTVSFDHIGNLFLPGTIDECYRSDSTGEVPGLKTESGEWETAGHPLRVVRIDRDAIEVFRQIDGDEKIAVPRFLNLHSASLMSFARKLSGSKWRFSNFDLYGPNQVLPCQMWDEVSAQQKKYIKKENGIARSASAVIYSGPNVGSFNPFYKQTKEEYANHRSYEEIDLAEIGPRFVPRTIYQANDLKLLKESVPKFLGKSFADHYRVCTRGMIDKNSERCIFSAILAPGTYHIDGLNSFAVEKVDLVPIFAGILGSLIVDGLVRLQNKSNFNPYDFLAVPIGERVQYLNSIGRRVLALNGLTEKYDELWRATGRYSDVTDALLTGRRLTGFGEAYSLDNCILDTVERRQCASEVDALVGLQFGLTDDELCSAYKTLFPVLVEYDKAARFDRVSAMRRAFENFETRGW